MCEPVPAFCVELVVKEVVREFVAVLVDCDDERVVHMYADHHFPQWVIKHVFHIHHLPEPTFHHHLVLERILPILTSWLFTVDHTH